MGWHTGTADNYRDLVAKLITAATGDGWSVERHTTGEAPANTFSNVSDELILQGPGFGDGYEVYFGLRTVETAGVNIFCLQMAGMTAFDNTRIFDQQPGISPFVYLNLWNSPITYWFAISDRRIIIVAKCSNTYHSAYLGYILPFSSPVEYPCPFYLGGDSASALPFGNTDFQTRGMNAPGDGGGYLRDPGGNWRRTNVFNNTNTAGFQTPDAGRYTIYPYGGGTNLGDSFPTTVGDIDASIPQTARFEPISGFPASMPMMPCYVIALFDDGGVPGVLEGVFWIPGNTFSAEQQINNSSDTFRVFIQISRSYEQPSPYFALKEA